MAVTVSESRKNLVPLIEQADDDHTEVDIRSKHRGRLSAGSWSRRIGGEHRLDCLVDEGDIVVLQTRHH